MADEQNALGQPSHTSPFDAIRQIGKDGREYWSARDMSGLLGYRKWENFRVAIERAKKACENSGDSIADHFPEVRKMITTGKGAKREIEDFHLSRHACYLLVENADPDKPIVALGQAYFAYQTRRQELSHEEALAALPENQKRLLLRTEITTFNKQLTRTAHGAGVIQPADFQVFMDMGYKGLYGGLSENDIHARKGLKRSQKILDHMGSEELALNFVKITQTEAKIRREQIDTKEEASSAHSSIGRQVRKFVEEVGGTMPEDLPTPQKSIQQLQREEQKRLEQKNQPSLFDLPPEV